MIALKILAAVIIGILAIIGLAVLALFTVCAMAVRARRMESNDPEDWKLPTIHRERKPVERQRVADIQGRAQRKRAGRLV